MSKIAHFMAITERMLAEELAMLFRDNVWKLYRLPESVVLYRRPQFAVELMKELNKMLEIKTKLLTLFYFQTDIWMRKINQELEQYLWFFVNLSYTSPLVRKQRPCGETTSEPYKSAFHSGHLSRNMSYGGAATLWVFCLSWQRYSYLTQSSMTELLLSVSQYWNLCLEQ